MREVRASIEPFYTPQALCPELQLRSRFFTCQYVGYLTHISSKYFTSSVLSSLTSTDGRTSSILLAYVILWIINIASLALCYIACQHASCQATIQKLHCAIKFVSVIEASKLITVEVESQSQTSSMRLRHRCRLCTHYIDNLLPHAPLQLCSYWGYGQMFYILSKCYAGVDTYGRINTTTNAGDTK